MNSSTYQKTVDMIRNEARGLVPARNLVPGTVIRITIGPASIKIWKVTKIWEEDDDVFNAKLFLDPNRPELGTLDFTSGTSVSFGRILSGSDPIELFDKILPDCLKIAENEQEVLARRLNDLHQEVIAKAKNLAGITQLVRDSKLKEPYGKSH